MHRKSEMGLKTPTTELGVFVLQFYEQTANQ